MAGQKFLEVFGIECCCPGLTMQGALPARTSLTSYLILFLFLSLFSLFFLFLLCRLVFSW
uniref:Uncharacterized protein n=1 Tax=Anguilla anguilla TaxID=7936 RepID=A0A0E9QK25_ANGAN